MTEKKNKRKCKKGFIDGSCCCNCVNLVVINKHPMNITDESHGSISEIMGYGCKAKFGDEPINEKERITFMTRKHGMCEPHFKNK